MKKLLSVFLSVLLVIQLVVPVWAAEVVASGECGSGVSWVLADDGTLVITGSGKMYDYASGSDAPWAGLNVTGVAVDEGVTYIGKNAFASCSGAAAIIFFGKAPSFSSGAFNGVTAVIVYIPDSSWTSSVMKSYGGNVEWIPGVAEVPTITKLVGSTSGLPRQTIVIKEVPYAVGYAFYRRPANVNGAEFELIGVQEAGEEETNQFIHRTGLPGVTYEYKATSIGVMSIESAMSASKSGKFPTHTDPVDVTSHARTMAIYSFYFGFYGEGETPSAQLMYQITRNFSADKWYIDYEINDENYTHEVPRAAFEEVVFSYFPRTEESLAELRSLEFYSDVTECYYFPKEAFEADFSGYSWLETKELGDELYQVDGWRIQKYNEDGTPYVPAEGDDYVMVYGEPAKIIGDITAKVQCANGRPMFLSNELRDHTTGGAEDPGTVEPLTGVTRIFGADRYETAFKTAEVLKQQLGVEKFDNIVVACGDNFADALGGSYLAAKKNAPILLVKSSKIDAVKSYIKANLNPGGTVYLLGGTAAIPAAMDKGLDGFTVRRLAGATRYDTNLLILEEAGVTNEDILICTGKSFADSLSAAAAGRPLLLVKDSLNDSQKAFLQSHAANKKYILGGTAAVSTSVENQAKAYGTVERIGGNTRYETSVLIAQEFFPDATQAALAYAQNFPDGLSGGALAYAVKAPLVLTASGKEAAAAAYAKEQGIGSGVIFGGSGLISDKAVRTIFQMQSDDVIKIG